MAKYLKMIQIVHLVSIFKNICLLCIFLSFIVNVYPENKYIKNKSKTEQIKELNKKVEVLENELIKNKTGQELYKPVKEKGKYGFAPASSKVYEKNHGVSIGGYGELIYQNFDKKDQSENDVSAHDFVDRVNLLRAVFYFGYKFTDKFLLNTEIEYENSNEIRVEFAYIDFLFKDYLGFRGGMLLVPLGFINELHEPTIFLGVLRPLTETYIIPTTWREIGIGIFGNFSYFSYKLYVINSFNGSKFNAKTGIRGGKQNGAKALAEDFGVASRLDYKNLGLTLGLSNYVGETSQLQNFKALTTVSDFHADFKWRGFYFRYLFSFATIDNVKKINDLNFFTGNFSVGEQLIGTYGEVGYDILQLFETEQVLILFSRYEFTNTQYKVPAGFEKNLENEITILTFGLSYKPIINIAVKFDYQIVETGAKTGVNRINIALTYIF